MSKTCGSIALAAMLLTAFVFSGADAQQMCGLRPCKGGAAPPPPPPPAPQGSCQPSSSLTVLVQGSNVVAYVPKGHWGSGATGISVANVEGASIVNKLVATTSVVNSCAANAITGKTACTANDAKVYVLAGTSLTNTLTSGGSGTIGFSGGSCTNCGIAMDAVHNKAVIGLSVSGSPGFQFLNLATLTFEPPFKSAAGQISEDPLIDPSRNLLLSASEINKYEIVNIANSLTPTFVEKAIPFSGGEADSSGEDCQTGIALAPAEFSSPSQVFLADLTRATTTPGAPGTWTAPSQDRSRNRSWVRQAQAASPSRRELILAS